MNIQDLLPWLSLFLTLCVAFGGAFVFRQNYSKTASEIQDRVIAALKLENGTLETRVKHCEQETSNLRQLIETIQSALKQRGIHITIDGDMVTIIDVAGSHTMRTPPQPKRRGGDTNKPGGESIP